MKRKFYVTKQDLNNGVYEILYSKDDNGYFHYMEFNDRCECMNKEINQKQLIEIPAKDYTLISSDPEYSNTTLIEEMKKQAIYDDILEDS